MDLDTKLYHMRASRRAVILQMQYERIARNLPEQVNASFLREELGLLEELINNTKESINSSGEQKGLFLNFHGLRSLFYCAQNEYCKGRENNLKITNEALQKLHKDMKDAYDGMNSKSKEVQELGRKLYSFFEKVKVYAEEAAALDDEQHPRLPSDRVLAPAR